MLPWPININLHFVGALTKILWTVTDQDYRQKFTRTMKYVSNIHNASFLSNEEKYFFSLSPWDTNLCETATHISLSKWYNNSQHLWTNIKRHSRGADTLSMLSMETLETWGELPVRPLSCAPWHRSTSCCAPRLFFWWFSLMSYSIYNSKIVFESRVYLWGVCCLRAGVPVFEFVRILCSTGHTKTKQDNGDWFSEMNGHKASILAVPEWLINHEPLCSIFATAEYRPARPRGNSNSPKSRKREGLRTREFMPYLNGTWALVCFI